MAAKRFFEESDADPDNPSDKRMRPTRPSFASSYQLMFSNNLSLPIFTDTRIRDRDGNPIQVMLVEKKGDKLVRTSLPQPIRLEVVVLDGDFPVDEKEAWTTEEFDRHILKERTGRRPLLTGHLNLTMWNGIAPTGGIEFTDNSSWIQSRMFRLAVRVAPGSNLGVRIREGMTRAFPVKNPRELYKKHYPPALGDEVWRLEKIGKGAGFQRSLSKAHILTVQDFLSFLTVDPIRLRKILGYGMSERMWEATVKHARTCKMGTKLYMYRGTHLTLYLNPICQVIKAEVDGNTFSGEDITTKFDWSYIEKLVKAAYVKWNFLEEVDGFLGTNIALPTQAMGVDGVDLLGDSYGTSNV